MDLPGDRMLVLLVEDNPDDADLFQRALKKAAPNAGLKVVENGQEAIAFLTEIQQLSVAGLPPDYIITDLKMPVMDGHGFLSWLQRNPDYCVVPTVVLSASGLENDVVTAYRFGATAYLVKPINHAKLVEVLTDMFTFWVHCKRPSLLRPPRVSAPPGCE